MYVSGALGILVDYLNNHLNKTLPQPSPPQTPLYIQNSYYVTIEKYINHHKISLIEIKC